MFFFLFGFLAHSSLFLFFFFGKCENVLFIVIDATNCSFTNAHATLTNIKYMYAWMIIIDVVCRCGSPISICRLLIFVIIFFSISLLFIFLIVKIVLNGCGHTMHEHQVHKWKCAARRTRHISREKWWCRAENMITVHVRNDNTWKCLRSSSSPLFAYIIYRMSTTTLFSLVGVGFTDIFCLSLSLTLCGCVWASVLSLLLACFDNRIFIVIILWLWRLFWLNW